MDHNRTTAPGEILLDKNTMITSMTDANGVILSANEDFCKIAGYSLDELIGKPHNYIRHSDMPKAAFKDLWETIQAGKVWHGIVKNRTKNGGCYWVFATAYHITLPNGQRGYISVRKKPTDSEIMNAKNYTKHLDRK